MDESMAYRWTAQALRRIDKIVEPHIGQQLADTVASAILEAYKLGQINPTSLEICKCGGYIDLDGVHRPCRILKRVTGQLIA